MGDGDTLHIPYKLTGKTNTASRGGLFREAGVHGLNKEVGYIWWNGLNIERGGLFMEAEIAGIGAVGT